MLVGHDFRPSYPLFKIEASKNGVFHLREPSEIRLAAEKPQWIGKAECIKALSEFAEEGALLLSKGRGTDVDWPKTRDWGARAEAYIREHISDESAVWFSHATTEPAPGYACVREYVDWLHTRWKKLGEFASEVRKG